MVLQECAEVCALTFVLWVRPTDLDFGLAAVLSLGLFRFFFFGMSSFSLWLKVLWHLSASSSPISRVSQNLTFKNVNPIKDVPYQV